MTDENGSPEEDFAREEGLIVDDETAEQAIARLEAEVERWRETALRAAAEAENTRRRTERELNDGKAYAITRFARDLLGVADNLSRALAAAPADDADPGFKNLKLGVEMTEKELIGAFERNGLKRLHPLAGDKFDPNLHQAMSEQPAPEGVPPGAVIQTMQTGYELFGRVVRPAMVVVAAKSAAKPAEEAAAATPAQGASAYAKTAQASADGGGGRKG